jgi:hypothetical protein
MSGRSLTLYICACLTLSASVGAEPRTISCKVESEIPSVMQALCLETDIVFDLDKLSWILKRCVGGVDNSKELLNRMIDIEDLTPKEIILYEAEIEEGTKSILGLAVNAKEMSQRRLNATGIVLGEVRYRCTESAATQ